MTPPGAILETSLYAADLDAAERFYGDLIGLARVVRSGQRHVFFRCGSGMLLIFNPAETLQPLQGGPAVPPHGATGPGHLCFAATAAEIEDWRRRLAAAGIDIEVELRWPNGARSLYVRDPAGNSIEFAEPALWQS